MIAHMAWGHLLYAWFASSNTHRDAQSIWALRATALSLLRQPIDPSSKSWQFDSQPTESSPANSTAIRRESLLAMTRLSLAGINSCADFIYSQRATTASKHFDELWNSWISIDVPNMLQSSVPEIQVAGWQTLLRMTGAVECPEPITNKSTSLSFLIQEEFFHGDLLTAGNPADVTELVEKAVESSSDHGILMKWPDSWVVTHLEDILNMALKAFERPDKASPRDCELLVSLSKQLIITCQSQPSTDTSNFSPAVPLFKHLRMILVTELSNMNYHDMTILESFNNMFEETFKLGSQSVMHAFQNLSAAEDSFSVIIGEFFYVYDPSACRLH